MKQFIDLSLREFCGANEMSKLGKAILTKHLKNKKYTNLVQMSKSKKKPKNYMKEVNKMVRDWDSENESTPEQRIKIYGDFNERMKRYLKIHYG